MPTKPQPNTAVKVAPSGRWTLRDIAPRSALYLQRYENYSDEANMLKLVTLTATCLVLAGCTGVSIKNKDNQPYLNGLPVKAIYYDDIEEPIGYGRYSAYLFILPENQFVILRNRENVDYFLSHLSTIESEYPSTKNPTKYTKDGNVISGLKSSDKSNDRAFKPHIYYIKYEGEHEGDTFHIRRSSWYRYSDDSVVNDEPVTWDFKKIREYQ